MSIKAPREFNKEGTVKIIAVDVGLKNNQIRCLAKRGASIKVRCARKREESGGLDGQCPCKATQARLLTSLPSFPLVAARALRLRL